MITGPRAVLVASFVALTVGFLTGWWAATGADGDRESASAESAPQPVGAQEHIRLGMRALAAGEIAEAERLFREAVRLAPDDPAPHADLAVALLYQERWEEAREELEAARRSGPDLPEVAFLEGLLYRDGFADTTRARRAWRRFLELVPADSPQAETVRGWLAEMDGEPAAGPSAGETLDRAVGAAEAPGEGSSPP